MFFYCISARGYGQRLNQDLPHNIQMQSVSIAVHFEPHNHQHSSKRAPDVERTRWQTFLAVAKTRTYGYYFIAGAGHLHRHRPMIGPQAAQTDVTSGYEEKVL